MSEAFLRYGLLAYYAVFFLLAFVARWLLVYRRTGVNPLVLPSSDDVQGYAARGLKLVTVVCAAVVLLFAFHPRARVILGAYAALESPATFALGWLLLVLSLSCVLVAQVQMGGAWRIGIDSVHRTELVQRGLFSLSRNPIFLAMRANLAGLFLVLPTAATVIVLVAGEIFMQVQVRLEELHLRSLHGDAYAAYCARVRRWL
jgi:protein-S-isoprenylcysteine O-methyltransferase Ste14